MIKAGSLYFALFISFIVTIILGSIIFLVFYSNRTIDTQAVRDQVRSNAESGITLALYDTALFMESTALKLDLYDSEDSIDNILLYQRDWGVYRIIQSIAHWNDYFVDLVAMIGTDMKSAEPIALYLTDNERYLSLSGNTKLLGNCYLPSTGVKTAYVEGRNYTGDNLVYGEIMVSKNFLPALNIDIVNTNMVYFTDTIPANDSLVSIQEILRLDSLHRSFRESTLVLTSGQSITLDEISLSGNIRVLSSKAIYVTAKAKTENIILYAPSIHFEEGFNGSLQAFAQDTIIAGNNCSFEYPSSLGLINENINGISIVLKENTTLSGTIFIYQEYKSINEPYLILGKNTLIHGQVYCPGKIDILGKIEGSVFCNGFLLKTSSGLFENHLLDVTIDRYALSDYFSGAFLIKGYKHLKNISWLN